MPRKPKVTDNVAVSEWLIENRWMNSLNTNTRQQLPAFVDDAVWAAISIVAGVSNGKVNVSPKLVMKALMLKTITSEEVKKLEVGYDMSDRQAQRLAQTTRFALNGIKHRIQEHENNLPEEAKMNWRLEKLFVSDFYTAKESPLYSPPSLPIPDEISELYLTKQYVKYGKALQEFRLNTTK